MDDNSYYYTMENYVEKFLGSDDRNLNDKLNIIESSAMLAINEINEFNSIFSESYGEMYYNFVIVRKYIYTNREFLKHLLNALAKIVHPNIQIFYGLMFTEEFDNKDNYAMTYLNIILEYFNGINLNDIHHLSPSLSPKEDIYIKLVILQKIAQTLSFLYKSNCPHLMINGKNIKLNHNLIINKHQCGKIIYCSNSYIENNLIKLNEVGSFLKYNKIYKVFSLESEDIYEISYHSPEILRYFEDNDTEELEKNTTKLEGIDVWSFGCLAFELFTGKRPFYEIEDKKHLIKTILNNDFAKNNEKHLKEILENKENIVAQMVVDLIMYCTSSKDKQRIGFTQIIKLLEEANKKYFTTNFSKEEIEESKKNIYEKDLGYFDFKKYEDMVNLEEYITKCFELSTQLKMIEEEIDEKDNNYKKKSREIENYKLLKLFNNNLLTNKSHNYWLKHLFFSKEDEELFILYNLNNSDTSLISVEEENDPRDYLRKNSSMGKRVQIDDIFDKYVPKNACFFFSLTKGKLYISGGEKLFKDKYIKRSNALISLFVDSTIEDENETNSAKKTRKILIKQQDEELTGYYRNLGNSLIKRTNHSITEIENYLFLIGGDQDRKCEILDLRTYNFYFIEELNCIHINPILFFLHNKLYSLNIDNIKRNYENYLTELQTITGMKRKNNTVKTDSIDKLSLNSTTNTKEDMVNINNKIGFFKKRSSQSMIHEINNFIHKNYIFCESYNTEELTSNPKWQCLDIYFNFSDNFTFQNFHYYKYITINDEYIYIIGATKDANLDSDFKLNGVCFNIKNMEFNLIEKKLMTKLEVFKHSLKMNENITQFSNYYYFLNCRTNKVEKVPIEYLFS